MHAWWRHVIILNIMLDNKQCVIIVFFNLLLWSVIIRNIGCKNVKTYLWTRTVKRIIFPPVKQLPFFDVICDPRLPPLHPLYNNHHKADTYWSSSFSTLFHAPSYQMNLAKYSIIRCLMKWNYLRNWIKKNWTVVDFMLSTVWSCIL